MRAFRTDTRPVSPAGPGGGGLAKGFCGRRRGSGATGPARCTYTGPWREPVQRSLLTLKALTYAETGGIVAAPTTSLPEQLGGERNWDYRYCWLRDATLTLMALMSAGYIEEAQAWRAWLQRSVAGRASQIQIMYGLSGERQLIEWEVPWLPGYQGAVPVRIGNAAADQLQLDVYGELIDAIYQSRMHMPRSGRRGLGAATEADRVSGADLAAAGRWNLGSTGWAPPFHPFEGHGVGRP